MAKKHYDWEGPYLAALRRLPIRSAAAKAAGIDRTQVWRREQMDPDFKAAVEDALEEGIDAAEREVYRRAVEGYEEPVIYQGHLQYVTEPYVDEETGEQRHRPVLDDQGRPVPLTVRKHSDALLAFYLKGRRKGTFAERTEITGPNGGPQQQQLIIATGVPRGDDYSDIA